MNCEECEKLINDYICNTLDEGKTDAFVKHVLGCQECLEELRINYSVITALDQMDRGAELSEDYDAELNEKIVKYIMRKKRRHRAYIGLCLLLLIASVSFGILFSMLFLHEDDNIQYAAESDDNNIVFSFDGVPDHIDPVENTIREFNEWVINRLHETELNQNNNLNNNQE